MEIVLNATAKKHRMKGAISLCTEVAKLLDDISRYDHLYYVLVGIIIIKTFQELLGFSINLTKALEHR